MCENIDKEFQTQLLEENNDNIKYYLINYSPIVFINGYMYKGNYTDSMHLMEAFCNSFEEAPSKCSQLELFQQYKNFSSYGIIKFIIMSVTITLLIVALSVVFFYYVYRRKINATFKVELNKKIDEALAKYYKTDNSSSYSAIQKEQKLSN